MGAGVSLRSAGSAVGLSHSTFRRIELGTAQNATVRELALACAAVGLELAAGAHPVGDPVRDSGQLRLLERLHRRLPVDATWATEVVLPIPGDRRALDARTVLSRRMVGFEAETRLTDLQDLERRLALKRRDAGLDVLILVVADTRHNREVLRLHRESLRASFPLDTGEILGSLARGLPPRVDGLIVI